MKYDAVILAHPKDYNKIKFCNASLTFLDPQPENVYLVTPDGASVSDLIPISDNDSISVDVGEIKYERPNWIYQQLIKIYQDFTKNNLYMCVDADVIFNRKINFSGHTFFISDREQRHAPYFNFMKDYFGITDFFHSTFINDFMIFDKEICRVMMPEINKFVKNLNSYLSNKDYLFSEFETYGNFVNQNFAGKYSIKPTKTKMFGKYNIWNDQEIEILCNMTKDLDIDLFTIHTWT